MTVPQVNTAASRSKALSTTKPDEACVVTLAAALRAAGKESEFPISNGGLDANWLPAQGIPTVTLSCGQRNIHSVHEELDIAEFHPARKIALRLATGTESR